MAIKVVTKRKGIRLIFWLVGKIIMIRKRSGIKTSTNNNKAKNLAIDCSNRTNCLNSNNSNNNSHSNLSSIIQQQQQ